MAKKVIIKTTCPCCGYVHEVEETYVKKHCAPVGAKKEKSVEIPGFLNRYLTGTKYGNYNRTIICDALEEEGMYLEKEIFSGSVTIKGKEKFDDHYDYRVPNSFSGKEQCSEYVDCPNCGVTLKRKLCSKVIEKEYDEEK